MAIKGAYNPLQEEPKILQFWLKNKFFKPEYDPKKKRLLSHQELMHDKTPTYCIIIPPPNAYGKPHMGNVSSFAYEDLFLRYYRQKGYRVHGQPGTDHAGIQGEIVVLREHFAPQGKSKENMTREEFYKETYKYFTKQSKSIVEIEKRVGLSADYDRNTFTLDPDIVKIVLETFIKLFEDGHVYKGVRIVNWCPSCKTALADIDTEKKERTSEFVYIKYPLLKKDQRVWELNIYHEPLQAMLKGIKTLEIRALGPSKKRQELKNIKPGDIVVFTNKDKNAHKQRAPFVVKRVAIYKNLQEVYENEPVEKARSSGKKPKSYEEWQAAWKKFSARMLADLNKYGPLVIELEPYDPQKHADTESGGFVTVATTRPETMLGDTAVVVNPKDKRYKKLVGRQVFLPLVWRPIPIITDPRIDKDLGTGALKLTPAHAPEDYEIMLTWNSKVKTTAKSEKRPTQKMPKIDYINVISKDGKIIGPVGKYYGMPISKAKKQVVEDLKRLGLVEKIEEKEQTVRVCERCGTTIEPIMSSQWFIKIDALRKPAIEVVEKGDIKIYPKNMTKKYLHWMRNLRDWPISRSLWWGYRFPVWYKGKPQEIVDENGKIVTKIGDVIVKDIHEAIKKGLAVVSLEKPQDAGHENKRNNAKTGDQTNAQADKQTNDSTTEWIQDDNVFDTWFSSGQWPYATLMKWKLFNKFYPTDLMETGYDILEFWVSRMIMLGLYRTGKIPFRDVYLHGLILAADGQKMSKSKGNVVYPDEVIDKYGADVLRLFYVTGAKAGAGIAISDDKLEGNKRFLNKLWNIAKFVLMNLKDVKKTIADLTRQDLEQQGVVLEPEDRQMLEKIDALKQKLEKAIKNYTFGTFVIDLRVSIWEDFADKYIEDVKPRIYSKEDDAQTKASRLAAQYTLYNTLRAYLIMLHPFVPFITERIWQELPKRKNDHESIMFVGE